MGKIDILKPQAIISATEEEVEIIYKLFPGLMPCGINTVFPFITVKDVVSQIEFDNIKSIEIPYIIISNVKFDYQVDEELLKSLALEFVQVYFKSRKKVLEIPEHKNALEFIGEFIVGTYDEERESSIIELFDTVGTRQFPSKFCSMARSVPYQQLQAALQTFFEKLSTPTTLFYKKASERLLRKYKLNYQAASENYALSFSDNNSESDNVLLFIKYHSDLFNLN